MTYNRSSLIRNAIERIFGQTFPPEKILVVDNGADSATRDVLKELNDPRIYYVEVGYNAGPAGAAKIGLQTLTEEGFDWIYWGDDDDPPHFNDCFEKLFTLIKDTQTQRVGIVGVVGQFFNFVSGELVRVPDEQLYSSTCMEVDSIAGNQCMIVNAAMVRDGCVPNGKLFFGFEELDYCFKAKKLGYKLMVSSDLFLRSRQKFNKLNHQRNWSVLRKKEALKREYYSVRNMITILRENRLYIPLINRISKSLARAAYGFTRGLVYGKSNCKFIFMGLYHSAIRKTGKVY